MAKTKIPDYSAPRVRDSSGGFAAFLGVASLFVMVISIIVLIASLF